MIKKKIIASVIGISLLLSLCACGSKEEAVAPVQEETEESIVEEAEVTESEIDETLEEEEEEPKEAEEEEEPEELISYVEEHGLEFYDSTSVETRGLAINQEDLTDYIYMDALFEITDVSTRDSDEEGCKEVIVEQAITGSAWTNGEDFKVLMRLPTALLVDTYAGRIFPSEPASEEAEGEEFSADIEWGGETYPISYTKETRWEEGDGWKMMMDGNYAGESTCYITFTITIPVNYDGLALLLLPVNPLIESNNPGDKYIMDGWKDEESYLFKIAADGGEAEEKEEVSGETDNEKAETTTSPSPNKEETANRTTKQEEAKPVHSHFYSESITANPTCSNPGTKTFTCACGESYTESIPATGEHQWVENTEILHHEEVGHNESTPVNAYTFYCRGCGGVWTSLDEFKNHSCDLSVSSGGFYYTTETTYENTWVVDQEAWDEMVTISTCSVCGMTR